MNLTADLEISPLPRRKAGDAAQRYSAENTPRSRALLKALGRVNAAQDPRSNRQVAEQLSSQLFFGPLLEEMRKSPFGREFGQGGRGEEVFGQQLDNILADAVASRGAGGLVDAIAKDLAARKKSKEQAGDPSAATNSAASAGKSASQSDSAELLARLQPSISTFSLRSKELP